MPSLLQGDSICLVSLIEKNQKDPNRTAEAAAIERKPGIVEFQVELEFPALLQEPVCF